MENKVREIFEYHLKIHTMKGIVDFAFADDCKRKLGIDKKESLEYLKKFKNEKC